MPEFYSVYWAARRPAGNAQRSEIWAVWAALLEAVLLVGVAVAAAVAHGGVFPVWLILWFLAGLLDVSITTNDTKVARMTSYVAVGPNLRALLRSLFALAALASVDAGPIVLAYLGVVVVTQLVWGFVGTLSRWLFGLQAPLVYEPGQARQPEAFWKYRRAYAPAVGLPPALLVAETIVLGAAMVPAFWPLAVVAAAALLLGWTAVYTVRWRRVRSQTASDTQTVVDELASCEPRYAFYVDCSVGMSKYVSNQWLPTFDASPVRGFVMVREASELPILTAGKLPVIYAPGPRQVERLTVPTVKVAFYAGFGLKNTQLLRDPELKHVMLNHGDSDKASSFNAQATAYDELWVAGQAAVDRYLDAGVDLEPDRFALIGRPQVESLKPGPLNQEPRIVLYAPTWEGYYDDSDYTSLDHMGEAMISWLLAEHPEVRIWFKPHPSTGRLRVSMLTAKAKIDDLLRAAGPDNVLVDAEGLSLSEAMNRADLLLTDVSSVASDFLATRRPLVVTNPGSMSAEEFETAYPSLVSAYRLDADMSDAQQVFAEALGTDPRAAARVEASRYILGDHPDGPQQTFNRAMARITS